MNLSIQNLIEEGQNILRESGINNSNFETRLIIQRTLKISNIDILINPKRIISAEEKNNVIKNIQDRGKGKPVSKIFGVKEFFSKEFITNSKVLDPRPETELLAELVIKQCLRFERKRISILELGVGSGCLIISVLLELKKIHVKALGVDLSEEALKVARKNLKKFHLDKYLELRKSNWFSNVNKKFDLIISNPPYIKSSDIQNLDKDVRFYDPSIALDGGQNGIKPYERIANEARLYLNDNGVILMEIGFGQLNSIKNIFNVNGYVAILQEKDLQGINRVVGFKLKKNFEI